MEAFACGVVGPTARAHRVGAHRVGAHRDDEPERVAVLTPDSDGLGEVPAEPVELVLTGTVSAP